MFNEERLRQYIKTNEGSRPGVYDDSLDIPTIGVGFNLRREDAKDKITQLGLSYDEVLDGHVKLSAEQVDSLLDSDIENAINIVKSIFSNFDQITDDRQIVLIDLAFNMGKTTLLEFKNMIKAILSSEWEQAADDLQKSKWYNEVGRRGKCNVQALRSGSLSQNCISGV
ncbi:MAG: glycoside hydrolase family protein [Nitrospirae bacterium]|nr:glycoside hydrolase family protein [Nitrospirota bacterium]